MRYLRATRKVTSDLRYFRGYRFQLAKPADLDKIKAYLFNPLVQEELDPKQINFDYEISDDSEHQAVEGFNTFSAEELIAFKQERGVGLDIDDLQVIQSHFQKEGRDPRFCEIKILDTYWSDHCRHTTFLTNIQDVTIQDGDYKAVVQKKAMKTTWKVAPTFMKAKRPSLSRSWTWQPSTPKKLKKTGGPIDRPRRKFRNQCLLG